MTEKELHNYIKENKIEWRKLKNYLGKDDVLIFLLFNEIESFHEILGSYLLCNEPIECQMKYGYFTIWMKDICDYFDIEMNNVFTSAELTEKEALEVLKKYNSWRRGNENLKEISPEKVGMAIDKAIEVLKLSISKQ